MPYPVNAVQKDFQEEIARPGALWRDFWGF